MKKGNRLRWLEWQLEKERRESQRRVSFREKVPTLTYGDVYEVVCAYCGDKFRYVVKDEGTSVVSRYCSKNCRKNKNRTKHKFKENPQECPTPQKKAYADPLEAERVNAYLVRQEATQVSNEVYICVCGKYHLGRWGGRKVGNVIAGKR